MSSNYNLQFLRCPLQSCREGEGKLLLSKVKYRKGIVYKGVLKCTNCGEEYPIENGAPNLLPRKIRNGSKGVFSQELTELDKELLSGIEWSGKMVDAYHENVVDQLSSALGARYIERYEDLYIDKTLNTYLKKKKEKVIFIEVGVGTGRYLIRYGSRMLNNEKSAKRKTGLFRKWTMKSEPCWKYRRKTALKKYFSYDIDYDKNLQLLIGIDYQKDMITKCIENLKYLNLYTLFGNRILLLICAAQYLDFSFNEIDELKDSFKVVTCMFQTLGNQKRKEQILLLKALKKLASPRGKIIVSVFNKERFHGYGIQRFYKSEVAPTVGALRDDPEALALRKRGILATKRGVYSQWFSAQDLKAVFKAAGLDVNVRDHKQLPKFEDDTNYLIFDGIDEELRDLACKTLMIAESDI